MPLPPRCCECSASLSHQYYEKDGQLFCKRDYWARYGESCHGCSEHITKGLVMVSALPHSHPVPGAGMCASSRVSLPRPSLVLLFTGSDNPRLLSPLVCLCVSGTSILAGQPGPQSWVRSALPRGG